MLRGKNLSKKKSRVINFLKANLYSLLCVWKRPSAILHRAAFRWFCQFKVIYCQFSLLIYNTFFTYIFFQLFFYFSFSIFIFIFSFLFFYFYLAFHRLRFKNSFTLVQSSGQWRSEGLSSGILFHLSFILFVFFFILSYFSELCL